MHTFVVVAAKRGCALPPHVLALLREPAPAELAFDPDEHRCWSDDTGRVAFGGWQVAAQSLGIGSHWEVRDSGLTAFAGHLWPRHGSWPSGRSWAAGLADRCDRAPLADSGESFAGVYAAVSLDHRGRGCIAADPLGLGVLYVAESDDVVVISTRAHLAARAVTRPGSVPRRDVEGVGWLLYAGYPVGDRTGYESVRALPQGADVEVDSTEGARVRTRAPMPWAPDGSGPADDLPSAIDAAHDDLARYLHTAADLDVAARLADLTGGKDSRLVLALLVGEGLADDYVFGTWGSPGLPDRAVAADLARRLGLRHRTPGQDVDGGTARHGARLRGPRARDAGFEARMRHHVWLAGGMLSAWDNRGVGERIALDPTLTGLCGGALRTSHPETTDLRSMRELERMVRGRGLGFDAACLLRREVREHYDHEMSELLGALVPPGGTPQDAIDGFHLVARLRRWFGTSQETDARTRLVPLYSLAALRAAFAMGSQRRHAEALPFELMRRSCDELAALPFAKSGWPEAAFAHLPDGPRYRHDPPPAGRRLPAPLQRRNWRQRRPARLRRHPWRRRRAMVVAHERHEGSMAERLPVLRSALDVAGSHPLLDLVDRGRLRKAVDEYADVTLPVRAGIHGAVTAAVWLDRGERAPVS